ncbi:30S ribosomal protein S6 [Mycoplasmatota bacterium]|nr:30S ribosomal protein S6 [Mycoplasmatota bacterium]
MKKYEAMYIIQPNCIEENRNALIAELNGIFTNVTEVDEWGMRELAYEILKHTSGYYVLAKVEATAEEVEEFERVCRIREDVIRFMIVKEAE